MKETNSREWVKNAAIVFLLILLVLTFFSNTIMNRSLPEVAVQRIDSGSITAKVRGTGKVESVGMYEVKAETSRSIGSVMVKAGQEVKAGDVLFVLGDGTSAEIAEATEKLRQLQLNYQKTAVGSPYTDYTVEQTRLERAEIALQAASDAYDAAAQAYADAVIDAEKEIDPALQADIEFAKAKLETCNARLEDAYVVFNAKVDEAQNRYSAALERLNYILDNAPDNDADTDVLEEYSSKLDYARNELNASETALSLLSPDKDRGILDAESAVKAAESELNALYARLPSSPDPTEMNRAYKEFQDAQDTYNSAAVDLQRQQASDGKSAALVGIDLKDIAFQIEAAKQVLAELTGGEENQILAKVSGVISSIEINAGTTPNSGDLLCTIEVPDLGYSLSFSCTSDQAKRLHIGDTATVSNYYWGSTITATLDSIKTDPKNPQGSKILTFSLKGDLTSGAELTLSVGSKSATYDIIVPNNSIRSDSNGTFVLVVDAKNSSLGSRYFARRVAVTTIATDDLNSAVTGDIGRGDYVITTSELPIAAGDQVRLSNS